MKQRITIARVLPLVLVSVLAACTDHPTEPLSPASLEPVPTGPALSSSINTIFLGSGVGAMSGRDVNNVIVDCMFVWDGTPRPNPCAGVTPGEAAYTVPTHPFWATPSVGTSYISPTSGGRAIDHACCSYTTFETTFALPAGAFSTTISLSLIADNQGIVELNGVEIGRHSSNDAWGNFNGPALTITAPFTPDPSGTNTLRVILYDGGGAIGLNYAATVKYEEIIDDTPPVITPSLSGTLGNNGWYTSDVHVSWDVSDPESDITSTSGCDATTVETDTDGITFTCTATSEGGTASESVTIQRDATDPVITFSGNGGSYTVDQTVAISCSVTDATSGIASSDCPGAAGDAYTFGVGTTTLDATATDRAGNATMASTGFTVSVTTGSLCELVRRWVDQHGIANSMCQQLTRGNSGPHNFINHVKAQTGKSVSAAHAAVLIALAEQL